VIIIGYVGFDVCSFNDEVIGMSVGDPSLIQECSNWEISESSELLM